MKRNHTGQRCLSAVLAALCLVRAGAAMAEDDLKGVLAKPYVTVNGEALPNAQAELLLREQMARGAADSQELRNGVREALLNQALMVQEARKAGLDKDPLVQAQIALAQKNVLAQVWQQKVLGDAPVEENEIKAEYDRLIARLGDKEYLVRHLLVNEESTAKLLIEKLQAGGKIANLAAEYSRDASTKSKGGLVDWSSLANFPPPFAEAVAKLGKGKFAPQPVRTELGWHVLQLEDARPFKAPTLEAVKPQLAQIVARRTLEVRLKAVKDEAKVQ